MKKKDDKCFHDFTSEDNFRQYTYILHIFEKNWGFSYFYIFGSRQ